MAASGFATNQLRSFINRIERMNEEIAAATADRKEIYAEAKGCGFNTGIMREVIRIRAMDKNDYEEKCALIDLYLSHLQITGETRDAVHAVMVDEPASEPAASH